MVMVMAMANPSLLLKSIFITFLLPCLSWSCPEYQKQALLQFKSSVLAIDSSLHTFDSWNSSTSSSCCLWDKVTCTSPDSNSTSSVVTALHLSNLYVWFMPSNLLAPLFIIRSLRVLDISKNFIEGQIPALGFGNLSNLVHLDLSLNLFNGSIPPQLFQLRYLQYLDLGTNNLEGGLSPEVGSLQDLRTLDLGSNHLSGELPKDIGNLTKLQQLSLSLNKFSNTIPEIGNLTKLQQLSLRSNKFSNGIPSSISNLRELEELDLSNNALSMEIPTEIGNLSNLSSLRLGNNKLTGGIPVSMQKLNKLNILALEQNLLTGEIPFWLFDFKDLRLLYLGGNNLTWRNDNAKMVPKCRLSRLSLRSCGLQGEIPEWISTQGTNLSFLDLSKNKLHGPFPLWLAEMRVHDLILSQNKLSGSLPPALFRSAESSTLALSSNNFSGELPENIGDAKFLSILMLDRNKFSGPIPQSISQISNLEILDLSSNRLSGNSFPVFDPQAKLLHADFSSNQFSGEVPTTFPTGIEILALGGNKFSGALPYSNLTKLRNLKRLELQDNNISGELPNSLLKISHLRVLNLRNNSLQGSIPKTLSNLKDLQILDLSSNNLRGGIPLEFVNLAGMIEAPNQTSLSGPGVDIVISVASLLYSTNIAVNELIVNWKKSKQGLPSSNLEMYFLLDLSNNQLSGEISASLGALKALKMLNLSHNKLSGKIPARLGDLQNVEGLDLSHNKLSGPIPTAFTKLQQLTTLDVSNNQLTGRIPVGGQMKTMADANIYANNSGLCGFQIREPCPEDQPPAPKPQERDNKEPWILREAVVIGYPVGFVLTIWIIFLAGYFNPSPPSNSRRRPGHHPHRLIKQRI